MKRMPTIVVIDDDAITLRALSLVLNSEEVEVRVADSASMGHQIVRNENPRLIILDVSMPDQDGLSLLADFRRDPATRDTPVLMLTGDERAETAGDAFQLGASAYMCKPFDPIQLRQTISDLLHR